MSDCGDLSMVLKLQDLSIKAGQEHLRACKQMLLGKKECFDVTSNYQKYSKLTSKQIWT